MLVLAFFGGGGGGVGGTCLITPGGNGGGGTVLPLLEVVAMALIYAHRLRTRAAKLFQKVLKHHVYVSLHMQQASIVHARWLARPYHE